MLGSAWTRCSKKVQRNYTTCVELLSFGWGPKTRRGLCVFINFLEMPKNGDTLAIQSAALQVVQAICNKKFKVYLLCFRLQLIMYLVGRLGINKETNHVSFVSNDLPLINGVPKGFRIVAFGKQ